MQALGLIETRGLIAAIESADAMLKAAQVTFLEKVYVGGGLVSIAVTGDVGAVKAAIDAGAAAVRQIESTLLISEHVIPRPHQELDKIMVVSTPIKNIEVQIVEPVKTESGEKTVNEDSIVEESFVQKEVIPLEIDKETIDKAALEYGLEGAIEILSKLKVIKLRNLAREYTNFGIAGRLISKSDKKMLLAEFKEYYSKK